MRMRMIVCQLDDICRLFADYCGMTGFPEDARAVRLMVKEGSKKLALVVESPSIPSGAPPEEIRFEIKRMFGGSNIVGSAS